MECVRTWAGPDLEPYLARLVLSLSHSPLMTATVCDKTLLPVNSTPLFTAKVNQVPWNSARALHSLPVFNNYYGHYLLWGWLFSWTTHDISSLQLTIAQYVDYLPAPWSAQVMLLGEFPYSIFHHLLPQASSFSRSRGRGLCTTPGNKNRKTSSFNNIT